MSFSTNEDLCSLWAYLEHLDPTEKFSEKTPHIRKAKLVKLLDAIRQWKPDVSVHHHAIARTVLAYFNDWGKRRRVADGSLTEAAQIALGILRSNWNRQEHGIEGMAVIREAFCLVRDFGRGKIRFMTEDDWLEIFAMLRRQGAKEEGK